MNEHWLIWGQGGHGSVVAETVEACGGLVVGWADLEPRGDQAIGDDKLRAIVATRAPLPFGAQRLALGVGDNGQRHGFFGLLSPAVAPVLVHPMAWRSPSSLIGAGTVLLPHAVVHARAVVGEACIINTGAIVEHDCRLGAGVHIAIGARLTSGIVVEDLAFVGAGAVIRSGVTIGRGAMVGAGAVVLADVAPGAVVVGNPAHVIRSTS